ncbi:MAG TPA: hypothetical protein VM433_10130 [Mycobacteriales bacterium]|nr:hypothetical protein [Mycobacteriales bacterium]
MRIPARHMGPPGSANGGVTCGRLAAYLASPVAQVTLRRPPPLDIDLRVDVGADGVRLWDRDALVAEAVPGQVDLEPPPAVGLDVARAAAAHYAGRTIHPFPGCFVCGTDREPPDGMGLRPGPVGEDAVAAVWTPVDADRAMVWGALDCPGGWAEDLPGRPMVLGRMTLRLDAEPDAGEPHVVQGWVVRRDGRKTHAGTSLRTADGQLLAVAAQVWLAVDVEKVGRR